MTKLAPVLDSDLEFLKDLRIHSVDGKRMLGDDKLPFNVSKVYSEDEFVNTWLIQFALGNSLGINYFNHQEWGKETNEGTLAAMVVDRDGKPVLFVPPVTSNNMTKRDYELLRMASWKINANEHDNMTRGNPNASMDVANKIKEHLSKKAMTLTDMVTPAFYEKHGIVPKVEQQAFYIRDVLNEGNIDTKTMVETREILYKVHRGEPITAAEKEMVQTVSQGDFLFGESPVAAGTESAVRGATPSLVHFDDAPYDPTEC